MAPLLIALLAILTACATSNGPADLLILNGSLIDGSGADPIRADVAVRDGTIVRIGDLSNLEAERIIDARDLTVAPGFIDMHNHSDDTLLEEPKCESMIRQGVTTMVLGEGGSAGPVPEGEREWTTLGGYFDVVETRGVATNICSYVGQTQIWTYVKGHALEPASAEEITAMQTEIERAMREGAMGLSSSLLMPPSSLVTTAQLVALASTAARFGGIYSTHIRDEGETVLDAIDEAIAVGRGANIPVDIIHLKIAEQKLWGRMDQVIARITAARAEGLDIRANVYPYTAGQNNLRAIIPPWAHDGGNDAMLERLRAPAARRRMKKDILAGIPGWYNHYLAVGGDWSRMLLVGLDTPANKPFVGKRMSELIAARGGDPIEVLFDLLLEEQGSVRTVYFHHQEDDMVLALQQPFTSVGSDGSAVSPDGQYAAMHPHPRWYGTFPRLLGRYVREQNALTLPEAVKKITSMNADKIGIADRGLLKEGYRADITIFDPETVIDQATFEDPQQYPLGIPWVIVNGVVVLENGAHTGALPGQVIRGPGYPSEPPAAAKLDSQPYLDAVQRFADTVLEHGRDRYGPEPTPLFVDGLHAATLEPARWRRHDETWVLSNLASQQALMRTLDGLTSLTGDVRYRQAAEDATRYALAHTATTSGLLSWGGHMAWDLDAGKSVYQYEGSHELKGQQPYFRLMWRVNPKATRATLEAMWAGHILDWARLDYNRHADGRKPANPQWDTAFDDTLEVPFPSTGNNLSFVNVMPSMVHSGVTLATLGEHDPALTWTRRLVHRWQEARDPATGLSGGQLSYREKDRAQEALGHVHPTINEAKIVASYHQSGRYQQLPLVQMQAGEALIDAGGNRANVGREFIEWASADLKTYARHSYQPDTGDFIALMTDGSPIRWQEAKTGYYNSASFAAQRPNAKLLWNYSLAYRFTQDPAHWRMIRSLARHLDLGGISDAPAKTHHLNLETSHQNWPTLYALIELHRATNAPAFLHLASRIADNLLATQTPTGLFPNPNRDHARTGDELPLALLHLAAAIDGKQSELPPPALDGQFFHCIYDGPLQPHQQKRADQRTYDHLVFYGSR